MELRQLTFLRFLAASAVVVFHFGGDVESLAWGQPLWQRANTAVSFFFVLSGFILTCVYASRGVARVADFYVARLARVLPLYWLALGAVVAYAALRMRVDPLGNALSASLLQAWWPGRSQAPNAPGWSLSVELFFYLAFPFLLRGLLRMRSSATLVAVAAGAWALNLGLHVALVRLHDVHPSPGLEDFLSYHPLTHVATFVAGICGGLLFLRHRDALARWSIPLMLGSTALLLAAVLVPNPIVRYHHNGLFTPLFLAFLWGLAAAPDLRVSRALRWSPLLLLGEASYGIYILQGPVALAWHAVAGRVGLSPDVRFWSYYVVLVAVSVVCFRWVEGPLRTGIKQAHELGMASWARAWRPRLVQLVGGRLDAVKAS